MAPPAPLKVLFPLHPLLDTLDFAGPFEILSHATHTSTEGPAAAPAPKVFHPTITAVAELTTSTQNAVFQRHISASAAHATLADYDVLVVPGGGSGPVLAGGDDAEPISLIRAWAALPRKADGARPRYLLSVCTGALFLAQAGALDGLAATTHADYCEQLARLCEARSGEGTAATTTRVLRERFVVNRTDEERGLRVITSGGVSCGMDASLWLIEEVAGKESRERVAHIVQYAWREGVVL